MHVCVEVDLKKPLVPQFILNDDIQRVKDEGFHQLLYALSVGKNRMELCPKQNQTDGEDSPAAEEVAEKKKEAAMDVLPNPDPQVGSEERPFGPWMLTPNRRRKRNQPRGKPTNPGPQDSTNRRRGTCPNP